MVKSGKGPSGRHLDSKGIFEEFNLFDPFGVVLWEGFFSTNIQSLRDWDSIIIRWGLIGRDKDSGEGNSVDFSTSYFC